MAITDPFSEEALSAVATQIAERRVSPLDFVNTEITETFALWLLEWQAIQRPTALRRDAEPMNRWHHQLRREGEAHRFARSITIPGEARPILTEISLEDFLAKAVDRAARYVDATVPGEATVRLVSIPTLYMHAMWLERPDKDEILVVSKPDAILSVELEHIYEYTDFCERLRSESAPPTDRLLSR
jgi:hypothetical protein